MRHLHKLRDKTPISVYAPDYENLDFTANEIWTLQQV